MTTGERIEQLARERGMSLHKLATLAWVSYNTVYSAAKRKSNRIDMNTLERLSSVLQVSVADLSGVVLKDYSDGSSIAVIDIDKINKEAAQKLTADNEPKGVQLGIQLENESAKEAFSYLLEHGDTPPEWTARLLTAFYKLSFPMQQMLISNAEELVRHTSLTAQIESSDALAEYDIKE